MSPRLFQACTCECNITAGSRAGASIEVVHRGPASTLRAEYCPPDKKGRRRYKKFAKPRLVATIRCAAGRAAEHGRRSNLASAAAAPCKRWRCCRVEQRHNTARAPPGGHGGHFVGREEAAESCSASRCPSLSLRHPGNTPVARAGGGGAVIVGSSWWERVKFGKGGKSLGRRGSDSERIGVE